jgi:hypothetical protein
MRDFSRDSPAACGERVGVRETLHEFGAWRVPLTQRYAPTSPRKRGEVIQRSSTP